MIATWIVHLLVNSILPDFWVTNSDCRHGGITTLAREPVCVFQSGLDFLDLSEHYSRSCYGYLCRRCYRAVQGLCKDRRGAWIMRSLKSSIVLRQYLPWKLTEKAYKRQQWAGGLRSCSAPRVWGFFLLLPSSVIEFLLAFLEFLKGQWT